MMKLLTITVVSLILIACSDPLGSTSRQQSQDQAAIAQAQSQERIAEWDAKAKGWQAQYNFLGNMTTTLAEAAKPNYWPIYIALFVIGGIATIAMYQNGKTNQAIISALSMNDQRMINGGGRYTMLPEVTQSALMQAYQRGDYTQGEDGQYYITMGERKFKALLPENSSARNVG